MFSDTLNSIFCVGFLLIRFIAACHQDDAADTTATCLITGLRYVQLLLLINVRGIRRRRHTRGSNAELNAQRQRQIDNDNNDNIYTGIKLPNSRRRDSPAQRNLAVLRTKQSPQSRRSARGCIATYSWYLVDAEGRPPQSSLSRAQAAAQLVRGLRRPHTIITYFIGSDILIEIQQRTRLSGAPCGHGVR